MSNDVLKALLIIFCIFLAYSSALDGGDFDVYLEAASKLSSGMNPYLPPYAKEGMGYSYSPFFIIVLSPFTSNYFITEFIWCLLSLIMIYRCFILFKGYLNFSSFNALTYRNWLILMILLSYQFISNNIGMVQITIFLMWIIFESLQFIRNGHEAIGGILLGIGINIKIMPVILLGYFFYRGYFKAFFVSVITATGLLFAPAVFWGLEYNIILLKGWWMIINPTSSEHQIEAGIGTHSMVAFLPVYLTPTIGEMPYQRNILNLNANTAILITNVANLLLVSISLLYFKSRPFTKEKNDQKKIWEISYFMLLIPLLIPHQQKYAFVLVMPMVAYLTYFFIKTKKNRKDHIYNTVFVLFCILMLVFSPLHGADIIGWHTFRLSQHYRMITIVTLLLIPISLYCHPQKLDDNGAIRSE